MTMSKPILKLLRAYSCFVLWASILNDEKRNMLITEKPINFGNLSRSEFVEHQIWCLNLPVIKWIMNALDLCFGRSAAKVREVRQLVTSSILSAMEFTGRTDFSHILIAEPTQAIILCLQSPTIIEGDKK